MVDVKVDVKFHTLTMLLQRFEAQNPGWSAGKEKLESFTAPAS